MTDHILISTENRVMTLRFNRADKKNAITHDMYAALADAMAEAETRDDVRVVLFSGEGDYFTSGNDLNDFRDKPPVGPEAPVWRFLNQLNVAEKPLVAAVNGPAVGVGLTMLLHCDLVLAAQSAWLSVPFVDLALVPEAASSVLLPARAGRALAADMFLTGRRATAGDAVQMGIVSRVVADNEVLTQALDVAHAIAKKAPGAVKLAKSMIKPDMDEISRVMAHEGKLFGQQLQSPEFFEAVSAFMQRREPDFG